MDTDDPIREEDGRVVGSPSVDQDAAEQQRRLVESERLLSFALSIAGMGAWELSLVDHTIRRSLEHDRIFGYEELLPRWTYETFLEHMLPEDRPAVGRAFHHALELRSDCSFECRIVRRDGEIRWIELTSRYRFDAGGRPTQLAGIIRDVTERRRAEEALRHDEARQAFLVRLHDALRPLADPVEIQYRAACMLGTHIGASRVGYAEDQGDGKTIVVTRHYTNGVPGIEGVYHYDDYGQELIDPLRAGKKLVRGDIPGDPTLTPAKKQAHAALQLGASVDVPLVKAGRLVAVLFVHQGEPRAWSDDDLTLFDEVAQRVWADVERARAEAALRDSEQRYRTLFDSIDDGVQLAQVVLDEHGEASDVRLLELNPAWSKMTGIDGDRARGKLVWGELLPGLDRWWLEAYARVVQEGEIRRFEHYARTFERWWDCCVVPAGGSGDGRFVVMFRDITERKRAEEQLLESDRRKDEYLAMLGHELRNPLGAIRNATELLRHVGTEDRRLRHAYDVLDRQSSHMSRIIDGLLDVSRIARGKIHLELGPIDVRDVVKAVLGSWAASIETRGLRLETEVTAEPLWITGDDARLVQVFDNLIGNAIKFTNPPGTITVLVQRVEGFAVVRVRDTGLGIRRELLTSIFEPFAQELQDVARSAGGLGLGLALAKGLVELHQGTIEAQSEGPGTGAELVVRLPLTPVPVEAAPSSRSNGAPARRILVVEDNADAAQMLRELLVLSGHEVTVASSGPAALVALRQRAADVVLCDLGLPGMSGYEVARAVREDPSLAAIPLVALTGYGQPEDRARTSEAGFDEHLVKPVGLDELDAVLVRVGERRRTAGGASGGA